MDKTTMDESAPSFGRIKPLNDRVFDPRACFVLLLVLFVSLWLWPEPASEDEEPDGLGPRLVQIGHSAPKGGGHFKIGEPYEINGQRYVPREDQAYDRRGVASWYGELFHGRQTSNGEIFDMERLSAAHPTLPLPIYAKVTNLENGLSVVVRVNDRGPFREGRVIDLSKRAAEVLEFKRAGTADVRVRYLRTAGLDGDDAFERDFLSTRGYSQYAGTMGPSGIPEVVIAVGPPGPPAPPPLPDRPERPAVVDSQPVSQRVVPRGPDSHAAAAAVVTGLNSIQGDAEVTSALGPSAIQNVKGPMIQAGFFANPGNAQRAKRTLSGVGPVEIAPVIDSGQTYYRVRVGPFADGISAAAALPDVADAGYQGAEIIMQN